MHYHNLYHVPKQNTSRIGNLARTLTRKAGRHVIDELLESFCQKIASLVNASVRDWKQCGMLVATGGSGGGWLRKSPTLKEVWDHYKDAFQLLELQCNWASEDDTGKTGSSRWPKVRLLTISLTSLNSRTEDSRQLCLRGREESSCTPESRI
jgi:hypothetical protein